MGLYTSINIASTGLAAERLHSDVISNNIANASTTRTQDGGPFKRSRVIFQPVADKPIWRTPFLPANLDNGPGKGVKVREIAVDDSEGHFVYSPDHPDAIKSGPRAGYVEYPNVNIVNEMVDLIASSRAYEANTTVIEGAKSMFSAALDIAK
ncbi:MAG: flagellar basal body rod protein FlgC [Treponema sp.]|nr:flagellar basal body rod protein FlgC [Treponema sp.]